MGVIEALSPFLPSPRLGGWRSLVTSVTVDVNTFGEL